MAAYHRVSPTGWLPSLTAKKPLSPMLVIDYGTTLLILQFCGRFLFCCCWHQSVQCSFRALLSIFSRSKIFNIVSNEHAQCTCSLVSACESSAIFSTLSWVLTDKFDLLYMYVLYQWFASRKCKLESKKKKKRTNTKIQQMHSKRKSQCGALTANYSLYIRV